MVVTSPRLSVMVLAAIPIIVFPLIVSGRGVRRRSRAAQDRLAEASAYAAEAVGAVRTMQAFGRSDSTADCPMPTPSPITSKKQAIPVPGSG